MRLVDTDVMIDVLRGYQPALDWFASLEEAPGLSGFVLMELMDGCKDKQEMTQLRRGVQRFRVYWPRAEDCNRALADFEHGHLSHDLGILDALIGECAVGLDATLHTFNVRHFEAVPNLTSEQPYERIAGSASSQ